MSDIEPVAIDLATRNTEIGSMRNPLEVLGEKYQPTKRYHDYLKHYWRHMHDLRDTAEKVCEIGVQSGSSLRVWEEFFSRATIYGIDVNADCEQLESDRVRIVIGDQGDPGFLERFISGTGGKFDVIIDDGSHVPDHQIQTFEMLFPQLQSGGIYAIEDIGVHSGRSRGMTFDRLKNLIDNINYWPAGFPGENWKELRTFPEAATWWDRNVTGVAFYRYIAFVMRGCNPEDNTYLRTLA